MVTTIMGRWCRVAAVLLPVCNASQTPFAQSCVALEEAQYICGLSPHHHLPLERQLWEPQPPRYDGISTMLSPGHNNSKHLDIKKVWSGLTRIANLDGFSSDKPVVLGFGVCEDIIVDAVSLLNTLVKEGLINDSDLRAVHHNEVGTTIVFFCGGGGSYHFYLLPILFPPFTTDRPPHT